MILHKYFTEYDDSLTQMLNTDPLGMTVIWSAFGQQIFNNRVSSISNDVRNYTLNLIHHLAIKELIESPENITLHREVRKKYPSMESLEFKQACLIHAENIFVYSLLTTNEADIDTNGILGVTKGRAKLGNNSDEALLDFTHEDKSFLLVRQLTLGVSGRYKTPFIGMRFFDKDYRYHLPESKEIWDKVSRHIENKCEDLNVLKNELVKHFRSILSNPLKQINILNDSNMAIRQAYVKVFQSPQYVGLKTKELWLDITDLKNDAAGYLYSVIQDEKNTDYEKIFCIAHGKALTENNELSRQKLQNILDIEPFLTECNILFSILRSKRNSSLEEAKAVYEEFEGSNQDTLPVMAQALRNKGMLFNVLGDTAKKRFELLLQLADIKEDKFKSTVDKLLSYHKSVMTSRGQSAWVEMKPDGSFRCNIKLSNINAIKKSAKQWFHHYYIDEFRHLISGLEGMAKKEYKDETTARTQ